MSPVIPSSVCTTDGCPNRAPGHGKCAAHAAAHTSRRNHDYNATRQHLGHGMNAWRVLAKRVLREQPQCLCGKRSALAHHLVPVDRGGQLLDRSNVRGMCVACHRRAHERR